MEEQARTDLGREGFEGTRLLLQRFLDVRYVGQSFELTVDCPSLAGRGDLARSISGEFYRAHLQRFGYADRALPIEVVNLRLKLELAVEKPQLEPAASGDADAAHAVTGHAEVVFAEGPMHTTLYDRGLLGTGNRLDGPALLLQLDTTIVVPPGWVGQVDPYGNLLLERAEARHSEE
jgi:N-methylhydantoinase A